MKKHLLLASLLALASWQTGMADIGKPLVDLRFTESGIINQGTEQTHICKAYNTNAGYVQQVYDKTRGVWLGCTNKDPRGYYYCTFDADDQLGKAFETSDVTWEFLFRLEDLESYHVEPVYDTDKDKTFKSLSYNVGSGTIKIIGCTQGGGWTFSHYPDKLGLKFEYYDGTQKKYLPAAISKEKLNSLATGQFYHIVATLNKKENTLNVWVNGQNVISKTHFKTDPSDVMGFPNIGQTVKEKGMWFCLGGDPTQYITGGKNGHYEYCSINEPRACENSCKTTWVYAKIYDHALTATEATSLYTADVKAFTEPAQPGESTHNILLDTRFGESSNGADASAFKAALTSKNAVATAYNSKFGRFEGQFSDKTNTTALQRDYVADPAFTSMLNTTYSLEVYMKATDNTWTNIPSWATDKKIQARMPLSSFQGEGTQIGVNNAGSIYFYDPTYGYAERKTASDTKIVASCIKGAHCPSAGDNALATYSAAGTDGYIHCVGVYNRTDGYVHLYINGQQIEDQGYASKYIPPYTNKVSITEYPEYTFTPWKKFVIGGDAHWDPASGRVDYPWVGQISIARIWGKALTADEVTTLYAAAKAENPSTDVTISASGYSSVCLPYVAAIPDGVTAYIAKLAQDGVITLQELTQGYIPYDCPVILKGTAGAHITLAAPSEAPTALDDVSGNLLESTSSVGLTLDGADKVYVLTHNSANEPVFRLNSSSLTQLTANKAFITAANITTGSTASKEFKINLPPTAVKAVKTAKGTDSDAYYDLQGRRILQPTRGIYIRGGKKVFVK